MEQIARPFLVLEITGNSAGHLGGVIAARTLPQLLFGVFAGVVSDWFDRRRVLLVDKCGVWLINVAFVAVLLLDRLELWHLYAYSFTRGVMMAFDQPARQSLIPSIVPPDRVTNALALMSATQNTMRILGASLGGFVYYAVGAEGAFLAIAMIYSGAVLSTWLLDVPTHARATTSRVADMGRGLVEGARFAFTHPAIRGVLGIALVHFTFGMAYMQVFLPLFAEQVLEIGSVGFGFMASVSGAGALATAIAIARRPPRRLGALLPGIVAAFGVGLVLFSLATYVPGPVGLGLAFGLVALIGGLQTSFFSLSRALMLDAAPEDLRGRVLSLLSLDRAFMSAGAAAAGLLAAAIGVQSAQIVYGAACALGALGVLALAREFRRVATLGAPVAEARA
jgi:MFS family permease